MSERKRRRQFTDAELRNAAQKIIDEYEQWESVPGQPGVERSDLGRTRQDGQIVPAAVEPLDDE